MRHDTTTAHRLEPRSVLVLWGLFAMLVAATGALGRAPALVPVFALGLVVACVVAYRRSPAVRDAALALDARHVVLAHAVRLPIGVLFLVELGRGALPALFALRAGSGDILVGALAFAVALARPRASIVVLWSVLGLADILMVVGTANYLMFVRHDPLMPAAMARLSYGLLPTFVVPVVVVSHLLVLARRGR